MSTFEKYLAYGMAGFALTQLVFISSYLQQIRNELRRRR